jgi:predicted nucleotidyltransferase
MLNNYLESLKSLSKKFAKENNIFDIVIYGSYVKSSENPNDTDILLIFLNAKLDEQLKIAQKFKQEIKDKVKNPDIKTITLAELFDSNFLARQGILAEGYSLLHSISFAERLGFSGHVIFTYNLKNLNHNTKTKFTYALIGRNSKGILKLINAESLGKGVVSVPIQKSRIFEDFLKEWKVNYKYKTAIISK